MECTSCGGTVSETANVCGYCGTRLVKVPKAPVPVEEREPVPEPRSEPALQPTAVEERTPPSPPEPPGLRKPRRLVWLVLIAVLISVAAGIVALYVASEPTASTASTTPTESTTPSESTAPSESDDDVTGFTATPSDQPPYVGGWTTIDSDGSVM